MRILLTGAPGFVGSHILDWLLSETDADIVCILRPGPAPRRWQHILGRHDASRVSVVVHNLAQPVDEDTDARIGHVDAVVSLASSTDIAGSIRDPRSVFLPNVQLVANLAEWARHRELDAFVHVSSEEVYGPAPHRPHAEWDPIRPSTHYSASKAAQEAYLIASWRSHGLPLVILNAMNQLGPMQDPSKLVPAIIRKTLAGESVPLMVDFYESQSGSGQESLRQYMHPRVLASAILAVLGSTCTPACWRPRSSPSSTTPTGTSTRESSFRRGITSPGRRSASWVWRRWSPTRWAYH